jgi:hypothetical protein
MMKIFLENWILATRINLRLHLSTVFSKKIWIKHCKKNIIKVRNIIEKGVDRLLKKERLRD